MRRQAQALAVPLVCDRGEGRENLPQPPTSSGEPYRNLPLPYPKTGEVEREGGRVVAALTENLPPPYPLPTKTLPMVKPLKIQGKVEGRGRFIRYSKTLKGVRQNVIQ